MVQVWGLFFLFDDRSQSEQQHPGLPWANVGHVGHVHHGEVTGQALNLADLLNGKDCGLFLV